jgi:hypothetical protein
MNFDNKDINWFVEKITNENQSRDFYKFLDELFAPRFSVAQLNVKRQEMTYWKREGIIKMIQTNGKSREWVKVNFFDYTWLRLVASLRKLNLPAKAILKLKAHLNEISDDQIIETLQSSFEQFDSISPNSKLVEDYQKDIVQENFPSDFLQFFRKTFTPFNILVLNLMAERKHINLLVDEDGNCEYFIPDTFKEMLEDENLRQFLNKPFISVPLHTLLDEFYTNPKIKIEDQRKIYNLTTQESKVLALLRKENIKEIRIKLNNKDCGVILIEVVEEKNAGPVFDKVKHLLEKGKFSNITLKQENGVLRLYEEVTKYKI